MMERFSTYLLLFTYNVLLLYGTFILVTQYNWSEWTFLATLMFTMTPKYKENNDDSKS
jgi:hypothetical protein